MKTMRKRYWRDVGFFAAGTFLGGFVLQFFARLMGRG